ncbi:MAG: transposase, partial [Candidatus Aenigmarchaeota archaeon]|nr:transposase [Candidatus Aenigmarchaeota archaeon]
MLRWKIEDFYKDTKQHLGLEKCQLRDIEGIQRHWYLVLLAHSVLKLGASESVFAKSILRSSIGMKVKRSCMELPGKFVLWLMEGMKSIEDVRKELMMLLY